MRKKESENAKKCDGCDAIGTDLLQGGVEIQLNPNSLENKLPNPHFVSQFLWHRKGEKIRRRRINWTESYMGASD
jgi:hypothetical protein